MRYLLVLFDNPNISKEFVKYSILLARDLRATVQLFFIQNPQAVPIAEPGTLTSTSINIDIDTDALAKSVENSVNDIIREIRAEITTGVNVEFKSETGSASRILEDTVSKGGVDMVLMQGDIDKPDWLKTITNMELIEKAKCPVLIIAPDSKYQPLEKIIYATDYKEEDIKTLKALIDLTRPLVTDILALHISESMEFEEKVKEAGFNEMLKQETDFKNISVKVLVDEKGKDIVETLSEEIDKTNANLIVVLKENRNFFDRIFKSSFTADVIKNVKLPVLVFHSKQ